MVTMYDGQEELDNLVWDNNDEESEESIKQLRHKDTCRKVEALAEQKLGEPSSLVSPLILGGFNILYRIRRANTSPDVMVRLPCPALVQFPDEKTKQEFATAAFVAQNTDLPIPRHLFYGQDSDIGPYVIMERVENNGSMSARLTRPNEDASAPHVLDANVSESTLENIWGQVAKCLLQLSRLTFPRIGSLMEANEAVYDVAGRPISHNMADMVRLANVPREVLPPAGTTYTTADEWYTALAEMHIAQLIFQHNDLVTSEDDCRNKYVARQIFRRLAKQGRFSTFGFLEDNWSAQSRKLPSSSLCPAPSNSDSFRLWGDDFRAGNILLTDSDNIAALIDWEYTYAAPTQFILDPPWWLLIETIEMWSSGMDDWIDTYNVRLKTWLLAMEKTERDIKEPNSLAEPLSRYMRESWETGRFFLSYGARKSWAFDAMYWKFLDERFFGQRESNISKSDLWKTRIHLLTDEERAAMEPFVEKKMAEMKVRRIVHWDPVDAKKRLSELLFD
ncbi:protein kinase-like domain [Pochonia chlamydosporia 170]|uniref:Protein kinase-like domain n=1 Tax=Pochonia chlamydosporia 170 TaxID=1380566 RepID=A0A179FKA1_METCM|nr:protein kinase-like domain [Pochonia chlamydosporia 170]OAQ65777.1 protein kinase-like domain [Pochonia chlamydosporia 170]